MKRIMIIALAVLLTAGMLFAGGSQESAPAATAAQAPTVLTFLIDNAQPTDGLNAVIAAAEKKLNMKIELEYRPGAPEGDNIIKTRLATGDMTDILLYNSGSLLQALNPSEQFVDLSGEPFIKRLDDSYAQTVRSGSAIFGVPFSSTQAGAWLYNKQIYADLGLSVPQTWDQLLANAEVIKAAGLTAIIGSYKDSWTAQLLFLADHYNVLSADPDFPEAFTAGKATYAGHPAAIRGWEKLSDSSPYMNKDYLATTYDIALDMLVNGEGAHYPMLTQALSSIYQLYPEEIDNIGVFGQPGDSADDHGLTVWMPASLYLYKHGPNVEAAKKFLEFYISDEGIALYGAKIKPDGPYALKGVDLPADSYAGVQEMQTYFDAGKTAPALEFQSPVKGSSAPQICVETGAGIKSAAESAAAYDRDVRKQAIQLGLPGWE